MTKLSERARRLIEGPNLALLADLMEDGSAHVSPVWIARENGYAVSIADRDDPYDRVDIRGRVVEMIEGEEADRQIDELARKYEAVDEYPWRSEGERRAKVLVEPLAVST